MLSLLALTILKQVGSCFASRPGPWLSPNRCALSLVQPPATYNPHRPVPYPIPPCRPHATITPSKDSFEVPIGSLCSHSGDSKYERVFLGKLSSSDTCWVLTCPQSAAVSWSTAVQQSLLSMFSSWWLNYRLLLTVIVMGFSLVHHLESLFDSWCLKAPSVPFTWMAECAGSALPGPLSEPAPGSSSTM